MHTLGLGVKIAVIGVGDKINKDELNTIGGETSPIIVKDINELVDTIPDISKIAAEASGNFLIKGLRYYYTVHYYVGI